MTADTSKSVRILVSRSDRIGDVILSLPVAQALKQSALDCTVDFLVQPFLKSLLEQHPDLDTVITYDAERDAETDLTPRLRDRSYDVVICLYPRPALAKIFAHARIPVRIGTSRRLYSFRFTHRVNNHRRGSGRHEKDLNLDLLRPLGVEPDYSLVPTLPAPGKAQQDVLETNLPAEYCVIHPGDGGSALNWPLARYRELAGSLIDAGYHVIITGVQAERERHLQVFGDLIADDCIYSGKTSLTSLAALLAGATLFIGGSTGPLHIAAAVGTPVIGLYGPIYSTTPDRWGPCGDGHRVFTPDVPVCRCKVGRCKMGNCLERVPVETLREACLDVLARGTEGRTNDSPLTTDLGARGRIQS